MICSVQRFPERALDHLEAWGISDVGPLTSLTRVFCRGTDKGQHSYAAISLDREQSIKATAGGET
jgi:hypothetical protein